MASTSNGTESECDTLQKKKVPIILEGKFFTIKSNDSVTISAECMKSEKVIKGRISATTNFRNHLKIKGHSLEDYKNYRQLHFVHPTKISDVSAPRKMKQTSLMHHTKRPRRS
ncbi:hypothetical protein FQA39_LY08122 [Lamprigera yunnana]|nr:hypothetical protein FQA39_LY08122 [Lamprigera yunnana]